MTEIGREFARLIFSALESPATIDKSELLNIASAFLDSAQAGDANGLTLARHLAYAAMDWCVWPECYTKLTRTAHLFRMSTHLHASG